MRGRELVAVVLVLVVGVLGASTPAGAQAAQAFLEKLQGLDAQELEAAVKQIAADDPDALPAVFYGLTMWLAPHFDEAALEAVRHWIYEPTALNGVTVPVIMTVTVSFQLS